MIGSIAHPCGTRSRHRYLDNAQLNREELRGKKPTKSADDNVSDEEKRLLPRRRRRTRRRTGSYCQTEGAGEATGELKNLKKTNPGKADPIKEAALAKGARRSKRKGWKNTKDQKTPQPMPGTKNATKTSPRRSRATGPAFQNARASAKSSIPGSWTPTRRTRLPPNPMNSMMKREAPCPSPAHHRA